MGVNPGTHVYASLSAGLAVDTSRIHRFEKRLCVIAGFSFGVHQAKCCTFCASTLFRLLQPQAESWKLQGKQGSMVLQPQRKSLQKVRLQWLQRQRQQLWVEGTVSRSVRSCASSKRHRGWVHSNKFAAVSVTSQTSERFGARHGECNWNQFKGPFEASTAMSTRTKPTHVRYRCMCAETWPRPLQEFRRTMVPQQDNGKVWGVQMGWLQRQHEQVPVGKSLQNHVLRQRLFG